MTNTNPLVVRLIELMDAARIDGHVLSKRAGLSETTIRSWRVKNNPNITSLEAVLNVLGYGLTIKRIDR